MKEVKEIVAKWLESEKKDNYVDFYDLDEVILDGTFSISNLIEELEKYLLTHKPQKVS